MPIYRVGIAYTETIRRTHQVLVAAATNDEAETITRRAFQRDEEVIVQGKNLGRMQEWEQPQPTEQTVVVAAMTHHEED